MSYKIVDKKPAKFLRKILSLKNRHIKTHIEIFKLVRKIGLSYFKSKNLSFLRKFLAVLGINFL